MNCTLLRQTRKSKGFTQQEMAEVLGYKTKGGYSLLEKGLVKCTTDQARVIRDKLGLNVTDFEQIFLA